MFSVAEQKYLKQKIPLQFAKVKMTIASERPQKFQVVKGKRSLKTLQLKQNRIISVQRQNKAEPCFRVNYPGMTQTWNGYCLPLLAPVRDLIAVSVFSLHLQMSLQD